MANPADLPMLILMHSEGRSFWPCRPRSAGRQCDTHLLTIYSVTACMAQSFFPSLAPSLIYSLVLLGPTGSQQTIESYSVAGICCGPSHVHVIAHLQLQSKQHVRIMQWRAAYIEVHHAGCSTPSACCPVLLLSIDIPTPAYTEDLTSRRMTTV